MSEIDRAMLQSMAASFRGALEFSFDRHDMAELMDRCASRADLAQAAVAAALEAAAKTIQRRVDEIVNENGSWELDTNVTNLPEWAETACEELEAIETTIRALITQPQHDALAAHVAAEVAKARDAALVEAADIILADNYDDPDSAANAILALRDKPAPAVTVRAYLLRDIDTGKEKIIDAKSYNPTKLDFWISPAAMASVEIIPLSAIAGGGDE